MYVYHSVIALGTKVPVVSATPTAAQALTLHTHVRDSTAQCRHMTEESDHNAHTKTFAQ